MFETLSFILGASIGSFVQVIATRLNVAPIMKSRSKCLSCGGVLRISDLVPVLSYLFLRGKCRYCKSIFGISALVIEVIYGLLFLLLYRFVLAGQSTLLLSFAWLCYYSALFITLGVIALYDKAHNYIPALYLYIYGLLTVTMLVIRYIHEPSWGVLLDPVFTALPFLVIWLVTKGKGLGFGDILMFLGVGAFFQFSQGIVVLLLSVWIGALTGLYMKYFGIYKGKKNVAIPFVPYIVIAFVIVLFTDIDIYSIATLFVR